MKHGSCAEAANTAQAARTLSAVCCASCLLLAAAPAGAQEKTDANELAKQLSNPVAALISVPLQLNYDDGYGAQNNGARWTLNIQPVVPVSISESWNMISRTIVPLIDQNFAAPGDKETGLGDITQSLFFSPKAPTAGGWIIGAGPALLVPSGGEGFTAHQWGAGPTAVVLKQQNGWTYGALVNHIWSFAGDRRSRGCEPAGGQRHVPAALRRQDRRAGSHADTEYRIHLRLARESVDRAAQPVRLPGTEARHAARERCRRRACVRGQPHQWAGLGPTAHRYAAVTRNSRCLPCGACAAPRSGALGGTRGVLWEQADTQDHRERR